MLNSLEMAEVLGVHKSTLNGYVKAGYLEKPRVRTRSNSIARYKENYWEDEAADRCKEKLLARDVAIIKRRKGHHVPSKESLSLIQSVFR